MISARAGHKAFILIFVLACAAPVAGQGRGQPAPLPEDPPKAFFSSELGDADVELLIEGLWEASLRSAAGFSSGPSGGYFNASPLLFTQRPDLYLLLTFMERWWFEAAVAEELERSRFALGFSGGDGDTVKEARLGNNGVMMADYPYLAFGAPLGAFGASLRAERGDARFDAMLRWDGLSWRTRRFFGLGESQESEIRPEAYIRGRSFVLPHANVEGLRLYDLVAGTPRLLAPDEYGASAARGTVLLNAAPRGALYAYYLKGGAEPVGPAPNEELPALPGLKLFELYERGESPIFEREALNLYALPQGAAGDELFVRSLASGLPELNYLVERLGNGLVQVTRGVDPDPRSDEHRQPFKLAGAAPWIYLDPPAPGTAPEYPPGSGFAIVSRGFIPLSALSIETSAVAGTLSLTRDGAPSLDFDHDAKSGALTLYPPPRAGERIEVRYAVASQDRDDGGIVFGAGTRFPWLGLDWALAAGGRWSLPGQAYAEGGELRPGWAGLSAATRYADDSLSFKADAFLRYGRESAASAYRAAGMEEGDAKSPFRLLDLPAGGVSTAGARADELLDVFPERMKPFHAQGQANYALKVEAGSAPPASIELVRYVETVPIAAFNEFAFFVRFEGAATAGESLTLRIDDGEAGGAGLELKVADLADLGAGWALVTLRLNPAAPMARIERADGSVVDLAPGSYDPSAPVSRIYIKIDGLSAGDVVWIDELHLADPRGGFSAQGSAGLALGAQKPADRAAGQAYLALSARGQLSATGGDEQLPPGDYAGGSVTGSAEAGFSLGPSAWIFRATPRYADGEASLAAGYALYLPRRGAPSYIYDEFSRDEALGLYARELGAGLSLGGGAIKASASAKSQEQAKRFSQSWTAGLAWATSLRLELGASLSSPLSPLDKASLGDAWLRSWELALALPEAEAAARQRSLSAKAGLLGDTLRLSAAQDYAKPNLAAAQASGSGGAVLAYGFKLGRLLLRPSYERSTQARGPSDSAGLAADLEAWAHSAARVGELWGAIPLYELWDPALARVWADSSAVYAAASHRAAAGASLSRPIGFGLTDLWAPSEAAASYARVLERSGDLTSDAGVTSLGLRHGAANLFGRNGALPTLASVEFDEYGSNAELKLTRFASDGVVLPSLNLRQAASFEGAGGWSLSLTNRFFWERTRSTERWNDGLGARIVTRPERSWFSRFLSLVLPLGSEDGEPAKPGSVGAWLQDVWRREPTLRNSYSLEFKFGSAGGDASPFTLGLDLFYETRVIQAGILSFGFSAKLGAEYRAPLNQGLAYWGGNYEISLDGRVSF